jgi:C4-dicarboxylate transporter DctM subunit
MITTILVIAFILLAVLSIGTPVAFGLGFAAVLSTIIFLSPAQLYPIATIAFNQTVSTTMLVVPLFILMAECLFKGGVAADIFTVLSKWMRKLRGGLAVSATVACTIFAALCGSSPATAAAIGKISINEMVKRGYHPGFCTGVVAAGGTLGIMIPPSMTFVVFGIITETSIAKLFIAGILPGLLLSVLLCVFIIIQSIINPRLVGGKIEENRKVIHHSSGGEAAPIMISKINLFSDLKLLIPPLILIIIVLGTLYTGMATATEASGIGATGAFVIIILLNRLRLSSFFEICANSAKLSVMIVFLVIGGLTLSYVVTYLGIAQELTVLIVKIGINRWSFLLLSVVLWLILGCILDPMSMVVMTVPFLFPTFMEFGFNPLFVGVVNVLTVEIGMITPPVGLNLFVLKAITDVPIQTIVKGIFPFVCVLLSGLVLLILFPELITYLPSKM